MWQQMRYEITQNIDFQRGYLGTGYTTLKTPYRQEDIKRVRNWIVVRICKEISSKKTVAIFEFSIDPTYTQSYTHRG